MPLAKTSTIKTWCSAMTAIKKNVLIIKIHMSLCLTAHVNPGNPR